MLGGESYLRMNITTIVVKRRLMAFFVRNSYAILVESAVCTVLNPHCYRAVASP